MARRRLNLLLIAATDSSGGSGLQADVRACVAFDCHPLSVVTAVTAQSPSRLRALWPMEAETIAAQLAAVEALPIAAVKIGVLPTIGALRVVAAWVRSRSLPVVVDPVFSASGGQALSAPEVAAALRRELLPSVALVTPNAPEFLILTGTGADDGESTVAAARGLLGAEGAVLLKGGHRAGTECVDLLITASGVRPYAHARLPHSAVRGTGCALSTACAAGLAHGWPLARAVEKGIDHVQRALTTASALGEGVSALASPFPLQPSEETP